MLSALALCSCLVQVGNGKVVTQQRPVTAFSKVSIASGIHATIARGDPAVSVIADENLQPLVEVFVQGDTLIVRASQTFVLRATGGHVDASVSTNVLVGLEASGGSQVSADATEANEWRVGASGGSTVALSRVQAQQLVVEASGGSHVDVFGLSPSVLASGSGGSQVNTGGVAAQDVTANASGGSTLQVFASNSVQGDASGGSTITVSGNPATRNVNTSGGSRVIYANE
jgi:hypothetical protein